MEISERDFNGANLLGWKDVSDKVVKVNPRLAEIINDISPDQTYKVVFAKYSYGSPAIKNDIFHLPNSSSNYPKEYMNEFSEYRSILPIGIILDKSVELFIILEDERVAPFTFYKAGKIFALWGYLDPTINYQRLQVWNMTAGGKSVFMLPKITDTFA